MRTICRISDAKKKALYESRVFNAGSGTPEPLASELSKLKMQEVAGHDIFNQHEAPQVHDFCTTLTSPLAVYFASPILKDNLEDFCSVAAKDALICYQCKSNRPLLL